MAAVLALAGCASAPGGPESGGPKDDDFVCRSAQQCRVQVSVACPPAGCRIAVEHQQVAANGFDVVWEIANQPGQSYEFANDSGIAFAHGGAFRCHREANGSRIACMNRNIAGKFKYMVTLSGAPAAPPLDPWVVNH